MNFSLPSHLLPAGDLKLVFVDGVLARDLSSRLDKLPLDVEADSSMHVIRVPAGLRLAEPLHIVHLAQVGGSSASQHQRIDVQVGRGAALTISCTSLSSETAEAYTQALQWNFSIESAGEARLFWQQSEGEQAHHQSSVQVKQASDSVFAAYGLSLGAARSQLHIEVEQQGSAARSEVYSLVLGKENQVGEVKTNLIHQAPHGSSDQYHKVVLADKARGIFHGSIKIATPAAKTTANLLNKNLLLDQGCEMDTRPQLEIDTDDVKCSHGATVSQLQAEELFYLQSRGIPALQAKTLLTHAYVEEFVQRLSCGVFRQQWGALIQRFLGTHTASAAFVFPAAAMLAKETHEQEAALL